MKKGFTIIEIIIVVGIIAVLGKVVLTQITKFKQRGEYAARSEFVRQTITALDMYYSRYGGYPLGGSESLWCIGLKTGETCNRGTEVIQGNTALFDTLKGIFSGLAKQTSPMWASSMGTSRKYDAIAYRPGTTIYPPPACIGQVGPCAVCDATTGLCQEYELYWYVPGQTQSCSPGFRVSCGTNPNLAAPYDVTYCQFNVPRRATDNDAC
jgi:prepilin-type N-terminal cleavage/methylation domain-containing protein